MNANVMVLSGDTVIRSFAENRSHARIVPFRIYVFIKMARQVGNAPTSQALQARANLFQLLPDCKNLIT